MNLNTNSSKKILFLYAELAQYFISCVNSLKENYDVEIHIVRWEVNEHAPFNFHVTDGIIIDNRGNFNRSSLLDLALNFDPDLIFCSGWMDKDYLKVCKEFRDKIPIVVGMDNQWDGGIKQQLARLVSDWTVQKWFSHAWVAGGPQKEYALKLGFDESHILEGVYSADYTYFAEQFGNTIASKENELPHRFLYVGRYIERKGIEDLWEAFSKLCEETETDWELWCCGTGPLEEAAAQHPQIKHCGFVQPKEMEKVITETSVFVLPSHKEPWGVVVHEFAAAGYSLICSDQIGAATQFLEEGENGYHFEARNSENLKEQMKKIISKSDEALVKMGKKSFEIASRNTPSIWANKLMDITKEIERE
ncbi:glycosyltransferase family 4 protein [Aliifodinibius salicampi]|uniref:Glycosyltransferase family 4 protein n=1 Tax=Fodinibius salicampi TaxID=1920655 RepID=A0ABT3PV82_9BACT|nr:glycosyltransferase family 4 protein [Fodinibius salicampi]